MKKNNNNNNNNNVKRKKNLIKNKQPQRKKNITVSSLKKHTRTTHTQHTFCHRCRRRGFPPLINLCSNTHTIRQNLKVLCRGHLRFLFIFRIFYFELDLANYEQYYHLPSNIDITKQFDSCGLKK